MAACETKTKMTQAIAESVAVATWDRKNSRRLYPYRCPSCSFWHMTKQTQPVLDYGQKGINRGGRRG